LVGAAHVAVSDKGAAIEAGSARTLTLGGHANFARKRENVGQEGFDALVHRVSPPYRRSA
jgi:hypothetical protein